MQKPTLLNSRSTSSASRSVALRPSAYADAPHCTAAEMGLNSWVHKISYADVANQCLQPLSKHAALHYGSRGAVGEEVHCANVVPGLEYLLDKAACYGQPWGWTPGSVAWTAATTAAQRAASPHNPGSSAPSAGVLGMTRTTRTWGPSASSIVLSVTPAATLIT